MRKPAVYLRSFFLVVLGTFLLMVLLREDFWVFLHPRLRLPSIFASAGVCVLGAVSFLYSRKSDKAWVPLVFAVFLFFSIFGYYERDRFLSGEGGAGSSDTGTAGGGTPSIDTEDYEFTYNGKEYTPINLAELYLMAGTEGPIPGGPRFTVRGMVKRKPEFDETGRIILARIAITCCLADATVVLYRVDVEDPGLYKEGEWLQVFGTLREEPMSEEEVPRDLRIGGVKYLAMETRYVLSADGTARKNPPAFAFMFEFKTKPPYTF